MTVKDDIAEVFVLMVVGIKSPFLRSGTFERVNLNNKLSQKIKFFLYLVFETLS